MAEPWSRALGSPSGPGSWLWLVLCAALGCGDASVAVAPPAPQGAPWSAPVSRPAPAGRTPAGSNPVYYSYTEAGGALRFVEHLDDVPADRRASAKPIRIAASVPARRLAGTAGRPIRKPWSEAEPTSVERDRPNDRDAARAQHEVVVYTTSWCPWCRKTLAFLDAKHVGYVNKDIEKNPAWRDELVEKTGSSGVPVVEIDGQRIDGFDAPAMERLL